MGPHAFFHGEVLFRHLREDAVLLGDGGFKLRDARAIDLGRLGLAPQRAPILQRRREMLQSLPLPQV